MPTKAEFRLMTTDPAEFRKRLVVDTDDGPRYLADVADPWQTADFAANDAAWMRVAGLPATGGKQRSYLERPRGHSKTSDVMTMAAWPLAFSARPVRGIAAAADLDQVKIGRAAFIRLAALNPWLAEAIEIQTNKIVCKRNGSELEFISSDAATSFGHLVDFVVADELCHWKSEELWNSIFSAAAKRRNCLMVVISNAGLGMGTSWQWRIREACRTDEAWFFSRLDGPIASWITPDRLAEQARLLPTPAYQRLWLNQWCSTAGDALTDADIAAAITLKGPPERPENGMVYAVGVDLAVRRDHSAAVLIGRTPKGRIKLAGCKVWTPTNGRDIDLVAVEKYLLDLHRRFRVGVVGFDPHQAQLLQQRLSRYGVPMREVGFVPKNLAEMAALLLHHFRTRNIDLYRDARLLGDLAALTVEEKGYGVRIVAPRDAAGGHCDAATALLIAMLACRDALGQRTGGGWGGTSVFHSVNHWAGAKYGPGTIPTYGEAPRKLPF